MGFKIGGLSLSKLTDINQVAELAIKANMPLNNLTVCSKLAESLLYGAFRKNSITRNFPLNEIKSLVPIDFNQNDKFSN